MNLLTIIQEIENIDQGFSERLNSRRGALKQFYKVGAKLTLGAIPFGLAGILNKAYGQTPPKTVKEVLNFALLFEYLEAEFYTVGLSTAGLVPAGPEKQALQTILDQENAHVAFLKNAIGSDAVVKPNFDFTAHNTFPTVFSNYNTFLSVAQVLEDTGVRAYKGQLENLITDKEILTVAMAIQATEARHAAHLRLMRRAQGGVATNLKPWIVGANDTGVGTAVSPLYAGEDNKIQAGIDITTLEGIGGKISSNAATAAFDEPLTSEQILEIMQPFMA